MNPKVKDAKTKRNGKHRNTRDLQLLKLAFNEKDRSKTPISIVNLVGSPKTIHIAALMRNKKNR